MKGLDTGKDKVKKICDALRRETLEPAQSEAEEILEKARAEAARILKDAEDEANRLHRQAREDIEKQKAIFQSSLKQGCRQTLELLKQEIEEKFFSRELSSLLSKELQSPKVLADLVGAVLKAIEKEGIDADLSIYISADVDPRDLNALLGANILEKLHDKSVLVSDIGGGIAVKLHRERMTVDISLATLQEAVARFLRKDFRELLFGSQEA